MQANFDQTNTNLVICLIFFPNFFVCFCLEIIGWPYMTVLAQITVFGTQMMILGKICDTGVRGPTGPDNNFFCFSQNPHTHTESHTEST